MSRTAADAGRLAAASRLLDENGVEFEGITAAGLAGEILVVHAPLSQATRLSRLAADLRALDFRFVTIDLSAADARA